MTSGRRVRRGPLRGPAPRVLLLAADLAGLAGLAADDLARIADALALVGLRLAHLSDPGGDVADQLLVDTRDRQAGGVLDLERDARGGIDLDGMAVAQAELELLAHKLGTIPHAGDLEALAVARGHAHDHVVDEGPGQAVQLP